MSAVGGILNFQPVAVDSMVLYQLWHSLSLYGPDSGDVVSNGSVGMVYRGLNSTPESRHELQPFTSRFGQMLVWDGRLDNRADLLPHLQQQLHANSGCITDVSIVMAAYQRWGFDFLPHIIGDFAFAMWEPGTQTLALARDAFGVRSLFYHVGEDRVIWSSILRELLDVTDVRPEVNAEYIAGFLSRYPEPWQTPYKGFHAVPPGQLVVVRDGKVRTYLPYWKPNPDACLPYRTPEEYEERFRHEFRDAIRCRLRTNGPAFAELSGGLDSSSIVCMADQVIRADNVAAPGLETVSYVYDEARSSDERSFIRSVEEQRRKPGHHINEDDFRFLTPSAAEVFFSAPSYHYYYVERFKALRKRMDQHGSRVILSGEGGDQLNFANPDPDIIVADYISSCSFLRLHRLVRDWSQEIKKPFLQMLWSGLVLLLPRALQIRYATIAQPPPWLDAQFQKQMNIADRMLGPSDVYGYRLPSRRDHMGRYFVGRENNLGNLFPGVCRRRIHISLPASATGRISFSRSNRTKNQTR